MSENNVVPFMPRPRRDYYAFTLWLSPGEAERLRHRAKTEGINFSEAVNAAIHAKLVAMGERPLTLTVYTKTQKEVKGNFHIEKATGEALDRLAEFGFRRQDVGRAAVIEWLAGLL